MYLARKTLLAAAVTLAFTNTSYAAPLDLDASFSSDGQHLADYSNSSSTKASYFSDVAVTPDDKIIAVGHTKHNGSEYEGIIVKHLSNGSVDSSFATGGVFRYSDQDDIRFMASAIQADGKILVAGHSRNSGSEFKLLVLRLNSDGTLDTGFADDGIYTLYFSNPAGSSGSNPNYGHLYSRDLAINSQGEIFISASQFTGQLLGNTRYVGRIIKLDTQGVLDTGFGYSGTNPNNGNTRITYTDNSNYSVDVTKLTFDANDNMYVGGHWAYMASGGPNTIFLQKIEADGQMINLASPFSSTSYSRWSLEANPRWSANTNKQVLNSAVVLPGGDIVSAGCDRGLPSNPIRMQRQTPTGSFVSGFGTSGVVTAGHVNMSDCYRDINYHPTAGIIAVGVVGTAPFISSADKDTGISAATNTLSLSGYFDGMATLSNGKIVAVGNADNSASGLKEAYIAVFEGDALTASSLPTVSIPNFTEQTDVNVNTYMQSATESVTITPSGSLTANVINGSAEINSVNQNTSTITVTDADNIMLSHTSNDEPDSETVTHLVIDRGAGFSHNNKSWKPTDSIHTFKTTTLAADTTPDAFSLLRSGTAPGINTVSVSATAIISGINTAADVSISAGAEYAIHRHGQVNADAYTSADGTIEADDQITIRHTNSSSYGTSTTSTLTIGGVTASYASTTTTIDTVPHAFNMGSDFAQSPLNTVLNSTSSITVSSITGAAPISITHGEYNINNGAYTSASGTVNNGDVVRTRHTTPSTFSTITTMTLNIGGVTDSLTSTTAAQDIIPNAFNFPVQTNVALNATATSASITVTGVNYNVLAYVSGGEMSVNGGSFSTGNAYVDNGDTIRVRHTSSAVVSDNSTSTLNVGGVTGIFTSVTASSSPSSDGIPDAYSFSAQTDVALSTLLSSDTISITGMNIAAPILVSNGEYSINGGGFTSISGTINNGDTVQVRHTSSSQNNTMNTTQLNVGGVTSNFLSTTIDPSSTIDPRTEPDATSGTDVPAGSGGSMNFLYLLTAGLLLGRKRKSK